MPNRTTRPLPARPPITPRTVHDLRRTFGLERAHIVVSAIGLALFVSAPIFALELGEASLRSRLGQALVVEIPYRLAANEQLTPACIGLVPARGDADALPAYTQLSRVSIGPTHIQILGVERLREPLVGLNVDVRCATVPRFLRSYQLLVDLPSPTLGALPEATRAAATQAPVAIDAAAPAATARSPGAASPRARGRAGGEIAQGQTYRVVRGDTLSGIAARVGGRPGTIRETADAVLAANPDAFAGGDRDRLEAGRSIVIPFLISRVEQPLADAPSARVLETPEALPTTETLRPIETAPAAETLPSARSLPAASAVAGEPSEVPAPAPNPVDATIAPEGVRAEAAPSAPYVPWLAPLLALGGLLLLAAPFAFVRRRRARPTPSEARRAPSKAPRKPIDSVAGIEVVEARLPPTTVDPMEARTAAFAEIERPASPVDSVDLDVGVPVALEERVDWFGQRTATLRPTVVGDETVEENAATARVPELDRTPTASLPSSVAIAGAPVDDEAMTLTVAELDMLRADYETEHTLTQQGSEALQEAVADLEATKASLAAAAETAELPQAAAETVTARVRAR